MKVILTGATGFIGGATLEALIKNPAVTNITVLSRRPLPPQIKSPKLVVLIIDNFASYNDDIISQLRGAQACIWCLGTPTGGKEVHHDFTVAGLEAVKKANEGGQVMKFVYVSGGLVEPDQEKSLWFLGKERKMRGQVEHIVTSVEKDLGTGKWTSFIARPAYVVKGSAPLVRFVTGWWIPVDTLGAALADVAVNGGSKQRLENADLKEIGAAALAAVPKS